MDISKINPNQAKSFFDKLKKDNAEFEQVVAKVAEYDLKNPAHVAELVAAGTFYVNEFIQAFPDNEDFTDMVLEKGTVNGATLSVETGFEGRAYKHAIGSKAVQVATYSSFVSTQMERLSWFYMLDIAAVRDSLLVKLMTDAAQIQKGLRTQRVKYVLDLMIAATLDTDLVASASTLVQATVNTMIRKLSAKIGGVAGIIGGADLIGQFSEFTGYSDLTQRDIDVKGALKTYHGIPLYSIYDVPEYIVDGAGKKYKTAQLDQTHLIYVGKKAGVYGSSGQSTMSGPDVEKMGTLSHTAEDFGAIIVADQFFALHTVTG